MEKYIDMLRYIREQSGWTTYQLDDSKIILWLVAIMLMGGDISNIGYSIRQE